jgi:hypothetical protein
LHHHSLSPFEEALLRLHSIAADSRKLKALKPRAMTAPALVPPLPAGGETFKRLVPQGTSAHPVAPGAAIAEEMP